MIEPKEVQHSNSDIRMECISVGEILKQLCFYTVDIPLTDLFHHKVFLGYNISAPHRHMILTDPTFITGKQAQGMSSFNFNPESVTG